MRMVLFAFVVLGAVAIACGSSPTKYQVIVYFNASVTQADMDGVAGYLRNYDQGLEFLAQETFPPTGVAALRTNTKHFCATVEPELEGRTYIDGVTCREAGDAPSDGGPMSNQ